MTKTQYKQARRLLRDNGAPDLAKSIADAAEKTIANGEPHADYAS